MAAYGNSIVAIIAGLVANKAASYNTMEQLSEIIYTGGFLNPFDIALMCLILCGILAATQWDENYGTTPPSDNDSNDGRQPNNWYDGLKNAFIATTRSRDVLLCGLISSLFEGSMVSKRAA